MKRTFLGPFVVALACSTVAEPPDPRDCRIDDDCPDGFVCGEALTCVDASNDPPLRVLGFDLQERTGVGTETTLRVEIAGCDLEVTREELELQRDRVSQTFSLAARTEDDAALPATFGLQQRSRFFRNPVVSEFNQRYPANGDVNMPAPALFEWPRHHPNNSLPPELAAGSYVLWTIAPDAPPDLPAPASRYAMLVPPTWTDRPCAFDSQCCDGDDCTSASECLDEVGFCRPSRYHPTFEFVAPYDTFCDRGLSGRVVTLRDTTVPLQGATVTIRHHDREAYDNPECSEEAIRDPLTLAALDPLYVALPESEDAPDACVTAADCLPDQACSPETQRCELRLAGRLAGSATTQRVLPDAPSTPGQFTSRVYTYCEDRRTLRNCRGYALTVTPPEDSVLPTVSFAVEAIHDGFNPSTHPAYAIRRDLCVPDWGVPYTLTVKLEGAPEVLGHGPSGSPYQCCDVSCLPKTLQERLLGPPPPRDSCSGRSASGTPTIRFEAPLYYAGAMRTRWEDEALNCHPPIVGANDVVGQLRRTATCTSDSTDCVVRIATGTSDDRRVYNVRVEPPVGSVFRSFDLAYDATDRATQQDPPELVIPMARRAFLRGFAVLPDELCDPERGRDCGAEGAVVLVERLRRPGESEQTVPGPYFHDVQTHIDPSSGRPGAFAVPLDPGLYVFTVLPGVRSEGGPAPFRVIEIADRDVPVGEVALQPGVLVITQARSTRATGRDVQFDRNSQITPLDTGSWFSQGLALPDGTPIDLNDPQTCLFDPADGVAAGCRIRRLTASASLSLSEVGAIQFTARNTPNATTCP